MTKTQVQIPDQLYHEAKRIAREREWSLAEVMRRGLEHMVRTCPPVEATEPTLPLLPADVFAVDVDSLDLKAISAEDESLRSIIS